MHSVRVKNRTGQIDSETCRKEKWNGLSCVAKMELPSASLHIWWNPLCEWCGTERSVKSDVVSSPPHNPILCTLRFSTPFYFFSAPPGWNHHTASPSSAPFYFFSAPPGWDFRFSKMNETSGGGGGNFKTRKNEHVNGTSY